MCRSFIAFLLLGAPLFGAPESIAVQDLRITMQQLAYELNHLKVDFGLLQERMGSLENHGDGTTKSGLSLEKRLAALEKAHDALISDFKTLKSHLNEALASLANCDSKVTRLENNLFLDIKTLKTALQALAGGAAGQYTVQPGDSLGQIALDHKTDIRTLKNLNNLSNDTIFAGQKLTLP